jgi:hypothetical protein
VIHRRAFVAGMAAAMMAPLAAAGQQTRVYRVGVILQGGPPTAQQRSAAGPPRAARVAVLKRYRKIMIGRDQIRLAD